MFTKHSAGTVLEFEGLIFWNACFVQVTQCEMRDLQSVGGILGSAMLSSQEDNR